MTPRKVCVVTGSRADYGLLHCPMRLLRDDPDFELQVVVTGMHLAPEFGATWTAIEEDGFSISARVDMLVSGDTSVAVTKSIGLGVIGFADVLDRLRPDFLLVLGDRFEILAAVQAALIARIPVAHLCGGDVTMGAFDDAIRHAITKMAHLHFVTNGDSARRVRQMGEDPRRVFAVGSPGIDQLREIDSMSRDAVFQAIGLRPGARNLLVTFHPATLDLEGGAGHLDALLAALDSLGNEVGLILTGSNADTEGQNICQRMEAFAGERDNAIFSISLGQRLYLNAMRHVDAIVGNSSSGLYEAPSFRIPTVNIGSRQLGRLKAASVIDCPPEQTAIEDALSRAFALDCSNVENPYGDGAASPRIIAELKAIDEPTALIQKRFQDWPAS